MPDKALKSSGWTNVFFSISFTFIHFNIHMYRASNSAANRFSQEVTTAILRVCKRCRELIDDLFAFIFSSSPLRFQFFAIRTAWSPSVDVKEERDLRRDTIAHKHSTRGKPVATINIAKIVACVVGEATTWLYSEAGSTTQDTLALLPAC